ncbi:hypothetical protein B1813_15730 [Saccharomonospora piscinae]|uniref:DUF5667 domain-containing protein n=1 Tax=Saccharomonospora piscinae TaxID=687388 RepID=A0A1V9A1C8_SACPI|nr:DUF5667 domain-containing protein [Saccharomonospora piscinae]OQO90955.1 hypothetical protein B1813_15730 [Saccharomonospora piscinae]
MGRTAWSRRSRQARARDERFARAVDSGTDADQFGAELAVVAALRRLGDTVAHDVTVDAATRQRMARRSASSPRRRPLPVLTALAALATLLAFTGLLLSRDALPGGPLYQLKRAQESAALGLTFDDEDAAVRRLNYASRRLDELATLGETGSAEPGRVRAALRGFADHATEGTVRLTALATRSDGSQLGVLRDWAGRETARLDTLAPGLPTALPDAVADEVTDEVAGLLDRIDRRASALAERMECYEITSAHSDDLGALPATGRCAPPSPLGPGPPPTGQPPAADPALEVDLPVEPTAAPAPPAPSSPTSPVAPPTSDRPGPPFGSLDPADVAPPATVPAPVSAPERPRLPSEAPVPAPVVSVTGVLSGLPAVTVG